MSRSPMVEALGGLAGFRAGVTYAWRRIRTGRALVQAMTFVVLIAAAPLVAVGVLVYLTLWTTAWRAPSRERARVYSLRDARLTVKQAEAAHSRVMRTAEKQLARQQKLLAKAITTTEHELIALRDPKGRRLAAFHGCVLYEMWITTPHGSGPVAGATATCDTAGNLVMKSRATLTRMAAGGLVLGPLGAVLSLGFKKHKTEDHRELYLMIETPTFASVTQCPPDRGLAARQFAAAVISAALNAERVAAARPTAIAAATKTLEGLRTERGSVPEAERALAWADQSSTRAITDGRKALAELEAGPQPAES